MPRAVVVLSDSEGEGEESEGDDESGSEESEGEGGDDAIKYESEEDDLDKLERQLNKREPPRRAHKRKRVEPDDDDDEDDDDEDDEEEEDDYDNWEIMRGMYDENVLVDEPSGYHLHHQLHSWGWQEDKPEWSRADKDALWKRITAKTRSKAFRDQWGIRAVEREHEGTIERVVERFKYGDEFNDDYENALTGNYRDAFFRVMKEVFEQEPYQAPPDGDEFPEPRFLDFKWAYVSDDPIGMAKQVNRRGKHPHGPFWCFCCQCTKKKLYKVTIARHTLSGIMVVTGGDCSEKFLGEHELPYNLEQHEHVGRLLGWA